MRNVNRGSIGGIYGEKLVPEALQRMSLFYTAAFPLSCLDIWTSRPFNSLTPSYLNMILNRPFIIWAIWVQYYIQTESVCSVPSRRNVCLCAGSYFQFCY